jgi:hypothetical protein
MNHADSLHDGSPFKDLEGVGGVSTARKEENRETKSEDGTGMVGHVLLENTGICLLVARPVEFWEEILFVGATTS